MTLDITIGRRYTFLDNLTKIHFRKFMEVISNILHKGPISQEAFGHC